MWCPIGQCKRKDPRNSSRVFFVWVVLFDDLPQFFGVVVEFVEVDVSDAHVCRCFVDGIGEDEVVFRIRVGGVGCCVDEVDVAVFVGGGEAFDGLVFYEGAVVRVEFVESSRLVIYGGLGLVGGSAFHLLAFGSWSMAMR